MDFLYLEINKYKIYSKILDAAAKYGENSCIEYTTAPLMQATQTAESLKSPFNIYESSVSLI